MRVGNRGSRPAYGFALVCLAMTGAGALAGLSIPPSGNALQQQGEMVAVERSALTMQLASASALPSAPEMDNRGEQDVTGADTRADTSSADQQQVAMLMPTAAEWASVQTPPTPEPIYADVPLPRSRPVAAPSVQEAAGGKMTLASASPTSADLPRQITHPDAPHRRKIEQDSSVLNDAQIASIKGKLHLTPQQERYWPAVEAALRRIAWDSKQLARQRRAVRAAEGPAIDMNGAGVAQLKSAAFPLVMSFTEDQKDEVRKFAHLIGLSKLAQEF